MLKEWKINRIKRQIIYCEAKARKLEQMQSHLDRDVYCYEIANLFGRVAKAKEKLRQMEEE